MRVPYDKTLLFVLNFFTLSPWPWSLTHFSKTSTIFWMVSDRDSMRVPYDRNFLLVPIFFYLVTLTLKFDPLFKNFNIGHIWLSYFICVFFMTIPFYWYQFFLPWSFTLRKVKYPGGNEIDNFQLMDVFLLYITMHLVFITDVQFY
jgi:hypothetical protein